MENVPYSVSKAANSVLVLALVEEVVVVDEVVVLVVVVPLDVVVPLLVVVPQPVNNKDKPTKDNIFLNCIMKSSYMCKVTLVYKAKLKCT